ncbi:hypothetical protein SLNWT_3028 [Streptomyces albus]|uniref:Uncharacterized protein n=1 Tax=Streptomyces albus (strain ATCC 21838 / DSM 41398 / FERM P-419 / JCM 4703 / NBRC 107858) TaxID=1081613 RepID=A0A0B5EPC4_STRA4|nr:hypothetical protein SLNWT_3028 [Streptomyces albus]AOU77713.1 hypothetical protein SLNHY_3022 [Streptomyces albus]AYN33474.1 hypothetical protein DUI70_2974 [Streptomyces albus]
MAQDGVLGIVAAKRPYLVDPDGKSSWPGRSAQTQERQAVIP